MPHGARRHQQFHMSNNVFDRNPFKQRHIHEGIKFVPVGRNARNHHDGQGRITSFQLDGQFQSGHSRHLVIKDHSVDAGRPSTKGVHGLIAICSRDHLISVPPEKILIEIEYRLGVVNAEDGWAFQRGLPFQSDATVKNEVPEALALLRPFAAPVLDSL